MSYLNITCNQFFNGISVKLLMILESPEYLFCILLFELEMALCKSNAHPLICLKSNKSYPFSLQDMIRKSCTVVLFVVKCI